MSSLGKRFERYTGLVRRLKLAYVINNLLNASSLQHNKVLYRLFGLRKNIFLPIGSKDFKRTSPIALPLCDQKDAKEKIKNHPAWAVVEEKWRPAMLDFPEKGYLVLRNFFPEDKVKALNQSLEQLLQTEQLGFNYTGRKITNAQEHSPEAKAIFKDERLIQILSILLGRAIIPFQSLNFMEGSEQALHSDSIHMTTEPKGYLIAAWTALESITMDNGPVAYIPESHRLPYITCEDYPSGNTRWMIGEQSNRQYENYLAAQLRPLNMEQEYFLAEPGDVLIWHANLIHGGSPIQKKGTTRRSMVAHYFGEGVICYHEITQRPALLPTTS